MLIKLVTFCLFVNTLTTPSLPAERKKEINKHVVCFDLPFVFPFYLLFFAFTPRKFMYVACFSVLESVGQHVRAWIPWWIIKKVERRKRVKMFFTSTRDKERPKSIISFWFFVFFRLCCLLWQRFFKKYILVWVVSFVVVKLCNRLGFLSGWGWRWWWWWERRWWRWWLVTGDDY